MLAKSSPSLPSTTICESTANLISRFNLGSTLPFGLAMKTLGSGSPLVITSSFCFFTFSLVRKPLQFTFDKRRKKNPINSACLVHACQSYFINGIAGFDNTTNKLFLCSFLSILASEERKIALHDIE
jgi:hypothetical protein